MTPAQPEPARDRLLFDALPFWGLTLACYADDRCATALAVAIIGPLLVLLDYACDTPPAAPARTEEW